MYNLWLETLTLYLRICHENSLEILTDVEREIYSCAYPVPLPIHELPYRQWGLVDRFTDDYYTPQSVWLIKPFGNYEQQKSSST